MKTYLGGVFAQDGILSKNTLHRDLGRLLVGSDKKEILVGSRKDAVTKLAAGRSLLREVRSHVVKITTARIMEGVADVLVVSQRL